MENQERIKLRKAKKRVEQLKGFYIHLLVYIVINTTIIVVKIAGTVYYDDSFMGPFWHVSTFAPIVLWGIGLGFHAVKVFSSNPIFGKDWEERQIQKYMDKEKSEMKKFNSDE